MDFEIIVDGKGIEYLHNIASDIKPAAITKLQKWILRMEATAKREAPVDQGQLRNSVNSMVVTSQDDLMGILGTNNQKAPYVEYGTGQFGKKTAEAKGVKAPSWYKYGPQFGHFVPFSKAPGLVTWLNRHGFDVVPSGLGRWDIFLKGGNTLLFRSAKGFKVSGRAQPFLTLGVNKHLDNALKEFKSIPDEIKSKRGG